MNLNDDAYKSDDKILFVKARMKKLQVRGVLDNVDNLETGDPRGIQIGTLQMPVCHLYEVKKI